MGIYIKIWEYSSYVYSFCGIAEILGEVFTVFSYPGKDMYCLYRYNNTVLSDLQKSVHKSKCLDKIALHLANRNREIFHVHVYC